MSRSTSIPLVCLTSFGLATVCHFLFSHLGFNPTDDGFVLAYSRRILEGEIPHLDFISLRPVGSPLLHLPWVAWFDQPFWISRGAVWFQWAVTSLAPLLVAMRLTPGMGENPLRLILFTLASWVATVNVFPVMSWHTTDGLFFTALGLMFWHPRRSRRNLLAALLFGCAPLFRQNFAVIPLAAILLPGYSKRELVVSALPASAYFVWLHFAGALPDAWIQLAAHSDFWEPGVARYLRAPSFWFFLVLGALVPRVRDRVRSGSRSRLVADHALAGLLLGSLVIAPFHPRLWTGAVAFGLFGFLLARWIGARDRLGAFSLLVAWASSVSVGYNTPMQGAPFLLPALFRAAPSVAHEGISRSIAWLCVPLLLAGLYWERTRAIYRDRPRPELTSPVHFPGAGRLVTNARTAGILDELATLTRDGEFVIVPDFAGYWAKAEQRNPLPIDWVQRTETPTRELADRVSQALTSFPRALTIVVQKYRAESFCNDDLTPIRNDPHFPIERYVRENFRLESSTDHFEIYRRDPRDRSERP